MKLLLNISLFIVVLSQLCLASNDITQDKRYPLFDLFTTLSNDYTADELVEYCHVFVDVWPEFNKTIASGNEPETYHSEDYHRFSEALKELFEALKKLEADKKNCDFQKEVNEKLGKVNEWESVAKFRAFDKFSKRTEEMRTRLSEILSTKINELYEKLPAAIESFQQNLDETEKKNYKDFLIMCKLFPEAKLEAEKYYYFTSMAGAYNTRIDMAGKHCKWDSDEYTSFMMKLEIKFYTMLPQSEAGIEELKQRMESVALLRKS